MLFRFEPILRPMVWGSELWVLSAYPERMSVVAEGPCKGFTLNKLIVEMREDLVGRDTFRRFGTEFPLLVKFLDVRQPLSIQVHPSELQARKQTGEHGKNEMWYVIRAEEGTELMAGLSRHITPGEYVRKVADGTITDAIAHHSISAGDVFFIPPGRIHALLPGSYVAEIQQTSDMTYRIFDYNRPGLDGKPRELHTALARDTIDYNVYPEYRTRYNHLKNAEIPLASCQFFHTSLLDLDRPFSLDLSGRDSFTILMCVGGSGSVTSGGRSYRIDPEGCLLVPAIVSRLEFIPDAGGLKLLLGQA